MSVGIKLGKSPCRVAREVEGDFMELVKAACQVRWLAHASYRTHGQVYFANSLLVGHSSFYPTTGGY